MIRFTVLKDSYKVSISVKKWFFFTIIVFLSIFGVLMALKRAKTPQPIISPIPPVSNDLTPPKEEISNLDNELTGNKLTGEASYYTVDGCLGCNPQRIMANGEKLDDTRKTIACNLLPLNTKVLVKNSNNGLVTEAVVTDRGGFGKYGRVADLSKAVKEEIRCGGLCLVEIWPAEEEKE